jgi:phytanoyl-CoA dioxygenase PhyH
MAGTTSTPKRLVRALQCVVVSRTGPTSNGTSGRARAPRDEPSRSHERLVFKQRRAAVIDQAEVGESRSLTLEQRKEFDDRGFLTIPGALGPAMVEGLLSAHDRIYQEERAAGRVMPDGSLHLFAFVLRDPLYLELLDLASTFPLVCGLLGWNIYMYHCHLDVHPPVPQAGAPRWGWHQDGGRQNLEIETEPTRPLLSVKVAYFLSDLSEPDRGNFSVIPGSQWRNGIQRPEHPELGFEPPEGAVPILAEPGTAVVFDRRLWHSRSDNVSTVTRKAVFVGYTYRWIRPRDDYPIDPGWLARLSPIRRQLLGEGLDAMSYWGLGDQEVPTRAWLRQNGLIDERIANNR